MNIANRLSSGTFNMTKPWNDLFIEATKPHWESMLKFAHSLARNAVEAEDIHQSALLKALKAFPAFVTEKSQLSAPSNNTQFPPENLNGKTLSENAHLRNWLMKIIKNTWLDSMPFYRRFVLDSEGNVLSHVPTPPTEFNNQVGVLENFANEESQFWKEALDDHWLTKMSTLNPRQKSVLFLIAQEYSYKEIAEIMDIPIGTVMSTLSRSIQKLKKVSD
jgi:RNA polymerase sigma factor (sigma-70 family)